MNHAFRVAGLMAGLLLAGAAVAQQPGADYDDPGDAGMSADAGPVVDPPGRVARLSVVRGAVSFVPAGENDWVEAQLNRPLVTGDKLWTDNGARSELQVGAAAIRVDQQTSINFLNLDDQTAQVEMTQGTLNLRVRRIDDGQSYEIDTPTLAFVINRVGEYRVDIAPDGNGTMVTVFRGSGDAYGEAGARFRVEEGQSVRFNDPQLRDYASESIPEPDDFDRFVSERDNRWDASPSRQYVSEDVIGYEDLDNNGRWSDEPEYGNVWYPSNVAAGWTPYSYGSWGWVGGYGWTWVDSAQWGFAPTHYGRWAYVRNRWGWCPGPAHVRAYYAPALVAFIGSGNVRVGFSTGAPVGWFPLGPRDVYVPGYRVSRDYFTRVNVHAGIGAVQINTFYRNYSRGQFDYARYGYANRNIAGAVTAVPGSVFVSARQVRGAALPVSRETFANSRVNGFAAVAPTRQSLGFGGARSVNAPRIASDRRIIAATRPPPPPPSFAERAGALQRQPGRAIDVQQLQSTRATQQGTQTMQARDTRRPNLDVVTTSGRPARLPAQALAPRAPANEQSGRNATPGFPSTERETRIRPQDGPATSRPTDVQPRTDARQNAVSPRPAVIDQNAEQRRTRNGQPEDGPGPRAPRENPSGTAAQEYRSAPVERTDPRRLRQQETPQREQQDLRQQQQLESQQRARTQDLRQEQDNQQRAQQQQQRQQQESQQRSRQQEFQSQQVIQQRAQQQEAQQQQRAQQQELRQQQQQQESQQRMRQQQESQQQQRAQQQDLRQQQQQATQQRAQQQAQQNQAPPPQEQPQRGRKSRDDKKDDNGHR